MYASTINDLFKMQRAFTQFTYKFLKQKLFPGSKTER